jgi:hypothetical protein
MNENERRWIKMNEMNKINGDEWKWMENMNENEWRWMKMNGDE